MRSKFTWIMTLLIALTFNFSFAQEKVVTGTVSDNAGPVPAATVVVRGSQQSVQTDFDGKFSINARVGAVLEISFLGYTSQTVTVGAANTYNVVLAEEVNVIDELRLDRYRNTTAAKSPSAITTISIEAIEDRANASVLQSLQGQVAGLNIGTGSGQPGADSTIILRGVGTINGNVEPLFIIDGIPVDEDGFRSINQNDISSFQILKDAAATSIYGNRGANGVIVINTKKGAYNQKLQARYSSQFGYTKLQNLNIDLMNSREILTLQRDYNAGDGAGLTDSQIAALSGRANTYWTDVFFKTGVTKSHDLALTTGSANTNNFTSIGYFEQDGTFLNTNFKRFTFRNNFAGKSENERFNYALNINANYSKSNGIDGEGTNAIFFAPFGAALNSLPYYSPFDANGNITRDGGITPGDPAGVTVNNVPYVLLNSAMMNTDREDEVKILANISADYRLFKNITVAYQMGIDYSSFKTLEILHPLSLLGPFQVDQRAQFGGVQEETTNRDLRFNSLVSLNYNNTFADKHTLDASIYAEYNKAHLDGFNFRQEGLDPRLLGTGAAFIPGTTFEDLDGNPGTPDTQPYIPTVNSSKFEEGLFSYFANVDYDYDNRFGVTASVRRDASFRFVEDNQWGTFFSVGARWNINEESFMENSVFDLLKLRASFGTSGNQRILNAQYSALNFTRTLYSQGTAYNGATSTVPSQLGNIDLQWEETEQTNIGIDWGLWKNRLTGSVDVYKKLTTELFQDTPISPINATSLIQTNIGAMENQGVELSLKYVIYDQNDWNITVNANGSYNKNKIRNLPESFNGISAPGDIESLIEGEAVGTFYAVKYAGVNPSNGNPLFYTAEGGLTETLADSDRRSTGKSRYPVYQGGFGTNISYKGFELGTQWSYFADVYRLNLDYAQLEETSVIADGRNRTTSVQNAWQAPGDVTSVPRVGNAYNSIDYINFTDRYVEDASFLRLRNVSVGYSFPKELLRDLPVSGLRFFVQGENLVTFSSWRGWDAESSFRSVDRGNYPTPKIYTFGAVINF